MVSMICRWMQIFDSKVNISALKAPILTTRYRMFKSTIKEHFEGDQPSHELSKFTSLH